MNKVSVRGQEMEVTRMTSGFWAYRNAVGTLVETAITAYRDLLAHLELIVTGEFEKAWIAEKQRTLRASTQRKCNLCGAWHLGMRC